MINRIKEAIEKIAYSNPSRLIQIQSLAKKSMELSGLHKTPKGADFLRKIKLGKGKAYRDYNKYMSNHKSMLDATNRPLTPVLTLSKPGKEKYLAKKMLKEMT